MLLGPTPQNTTCFRNARGLHDRRSTIVFAFRCQPPSRKAHQSQSFQHRLDIVRWHPCCHCFFYQRFKQGEGPLSRTSISERRKVHKLLKGYLLRSISNVIKCASNRRGAELCQILCSDAELSRRFALRDRLPVAQCHSLSIKKSLRAMVSPMPTASPFFLRVKLNNFEIALR